MSEWENNSGRGMLSQSTRNVELLLTKQSIHFAYLVDRWINEWVDGGGQEPDSKSRR